MATSPIGAWHRIVPVAVLAAAIVQQCRLSLDCDVSWLLTAGDHLLDGQRLYVDILETNPPASVLLYLPALLLGRLTGMRAEAATVLLVLLLAVAMIAASARILIRAALLAPQHAPAARAIALAILTLLPAACFAQREQIALLTMLPMMAVTMARSAARSSAPPVARRAALLAGVGGGVTMAIKPHFALPILFGCLWSCGRARSWKTLIVPETIAAGVLVFGYGVTVVTLFPHFLHDSLPVLRAAYLPSRDSLIHLLDKPALLVSACAALVALRLADRPVGMPTVMVPLLGALGFLLAAIAQGKGYLNHYYPVAALALLALAAALARAPGGRDRRLAAAILLVLALLGTQCFANVSGYPGLYAAVKRVAPPYPKIIVAGGSLDIGHPLTRQLDGRWVGRAPSLWISANVAGLLSRPGLSRDPAMRRTVIGYARRDATMFAEDVRRGQPDVVLVEGGDALGWIHANAEVARALADYRAVDHVGQIQIWMRPRASTLRPG